MLNLKGKKALVTGSGRGIGREIALALAECGAEVFIHYIGNDEAAYDTKKMIDKTGAKSEFVKVDLCGADCADRIYEKTGDVDILVLNASIQYRKKWNEITLPEFDDQVNCNFRASLLLIQKYAPFMMKNNWGRIVTIGSVQEAKPHPDMLIYSSTKAAQTLMAKSLALQLCEYGITVNCIAPGVIATDRNKDALADEEYRKIVLSKIPMGRAGGAQEFKGLIQVLCSDEGSYITGQNIYVDGGMSIK
jgi:Dehydrogenases with different specificities (related to short-chain alcohol dehydrogenases)